MEKQALYALLLKKLMCFVEGGEVQPDSQQSFGVRFSGILFPYDRQSMGSGRRGL